MENKITIHPSGVGGFFECQFKWFRDNLYKPKHLISYRASLGTGIHKGAELQYKESIKAGKYIPFKDEFSQSSIDTFRENIKSSDVSDIKEVDINKVEKLIQTASKTYGDDISKLNDDKLPIDVEKSYFLPINSTLVSGISGTLDIIGDNYIVDIKTMGKNKATSTYAIQQGIYALLRIHAGEPVNKLLIDKIILGSGIKETKITCNREGILEDKFTPVGAFVQHSKTLLNVILNKVETYAKTGDESLFIGNPLCWKCNKKYCAYYDECKYHL